MQGGGSLNYGRGTGHDSVLLGNRRSSTQEYRSHGGRYRGISGGGTYRPTRSIGYPGTGGGSDRMTLPSCVNAAMGNDGRLHFIVGNKLIPYVGNSFMQEVNAMASQSLVGRCNRCKGRGSLQAVCRNRIK